MTGLTAETTKGDYFLYKCASLISCIIERGNVKATNVVIGAIPEEYQKSLQPPAILQAMVITIGGSCYPELPPNIFMMCAAMIGSDSDLGQQRSVEKEFDFIERHFDCIKK